MSIQPESKWGRTLIRADASIRDALNAINGSGLLIACQVDAEGRLIGIVTDSDLRRALLVGKKLDDQFEQLKQLVRQCLLTDRDETLQMTLRRMLRDKKQTMATAKSCKFSATPEAP